MRLWLLLIPMFLAVIVIMAIATRIRGTAILNDEDHRRSTILGFAANFALFVVCAAFTPFMPGVLSSLGLIMIIPAALLYFLSVMALARSKGGLVTEGIYRWSRNPMYVAMVDILLAFSLMAAQSRPLIALVMLASTVGFMFLIRSRVADEEAFLSTRYPEAWIAWTKTTARYLPLMRRGPR